MREHKAEANERTRKKTKTKYNNKTRKQTNRMRLYRFVGSGHDRKIGWHGHRGVFTPTVQRLLDWRHISTRMCHITHVVPYSEYIYLTHLTVQRIQLSVCQMNCCRCFSFLRWLCHATNRNTRAMHTCITRDNRCM